MQLRKLLIAPDISQLQPCLPVSGFEQRNSAAEQNGGDLNDKLIDKFFLQNRVRRTHSRRQSKSACLLGVSMLL